MLGGAVRFGMESGWKTASGGRLRRRRGDVVGGDTVRSNIRGHALEVWGGVGLVAGMLLVGGCVTNEEILAVRRDVAALRSELATLNRANQSARDFTEERLGKLEAEVRGRVESSVKESEGSRVALHQRLEELTTETRFVQGKLEENGSVLRDLQARLDEVDQRTRQTGQRMDALDQRTLQFGQRVETVDQQVKAADQMARATDQQLKGIGQRLQIVEQSRMGVAPPAVAPTAPMATAPGTAMAPGQPPVVGQPPPGAPQMPVAQPPASPGPPMATAPSPAPAPPARPEPVLPPEDLYKAALSDYTKGEYDLAITGFRSYLKNYPRTSLTPNAQYWLAECYFSQRNYGQAVEAFDAVIREYPDSPKVPSALFKQGEAYLQAGDTTNGTAVLCELMRKHGKTREARLARDKNLRCR